MRLMSGTGRHTRKHIKNNEFTRGYVQLCVCLRLCLCLWLGVRVSVCCVFVWQHNELSDWFEIAVRCRFKWLRTKGAS